MKEERIYHPNGKIACIRETNVNGFVRETTFNEHGKTSHCKDSTGFLSECTYDEHGNETSYRNSNGFSCESTYDEHGNELTYKNSERCYQIKNKSVTMEEFYKFINWKPELKRI